MLEGTAFGRMRRDSSLRLGFDDARLVMMSLSAYGCSEGAESNLSV